MRSRSRPVTGATTFDFADFEWVSFIADTVDTAHAGLNVALLPGVLDWTAGVNYATATGRIDTRNPVAPASGTAAQRASARAKPMPAFEDSLLRLDAALKYHFAKAWTATLGYAFESFQKDDWRTDTLRPFMPGVTSIWLGNDARNYDAHIVGLTLSYRFR
jgi:putative beta-barrel porin MtrB/PioB